MMFDDSAWFLVASMATELHATLCHDDFLVFSLKLQNMWVYVWFLMQAE
jgi:hypothetical protein